MFQEAIADNIFSTAFPTVFSTVFSTVADAFFKAGDIEAWGRGISKIIEACRRDGITGPCYDVTTGSGFSLLLDASQRFKELSREFTSDHPQGVKQGVKSDRYEMILSEIRKDPSTSFAKIAQATGLSIKIVERSVGVLKSKGILERVGTSRGGNWIIRTP